MRACKIDSCNPRKVTKNPLYNIKLGVSKFMTENTNSTCPSCGFPKEYPNKPLCTYCYYRGNNGTMKMIILNVMKEADKRFTTDELLDTLNDLDYIGKPVNRRTLKKQLTRYSSSRIRIMTGRKVRRKTGGRYKIERKPTQRGFRRLEEYLKRWKMGYPVMLARPKNFKMTSERKNRARSIRGKITQEYPLFTYIFPERRRQLNAQL